MVEERAVPAGVGLGAGDPDHLAPCIHDQRGFLRWGPKTEGDGIVSIGMREERGLGTEWVLWGWGLFQVLGSG